MIVKSMKSAGVCCALWVTVGAILLINGCFTPSGLDTGRNDVDDYEVLTLSSELPAPALVEVTQGGLRQVELCWPALASKVYRYRIERADAIEGPFVFVANVNPELRRFVDGSTEQTRLNESTTYYYRLISIISRQGPRSLPSSVLSATTAPPPDPVVDLRVEASGSRANTLSWSAPQGMGIASYRIERTPADKPDSYVAVGNTKLTSFVDGGTPASALLDSTKYSYRVVTINEVLSESTPSQSGEVTTFPPPQRVTGLKGLAGEVRCVPLEWSVSPEPDIIGYHIYRARKEGEEFVKLAVVAGRDNNHYLDGGENPGDLEDEGRYLYQVKALNAVGAESVTADTVAIITRPVPPVIKEVRAQSGMPREVLVEWKLSEDTSIVGYEIWRSLQGSDEWQQIKLIENRQVSRFLDRGEEQDLAKLGRLLDGSEYVYRVISYNTGGVRSSASEPVVAKTKVIPVTPSDVTASSGLAGVIKVSWKSNPETDIKYYEIEVSSKESSGFENLRTLTAGDQAVMLAEEDSLKVSVVRYYRVKAVAHDRLQSEWSPAVSGITKALPDAPSDLQQSSDNGNVLLKWTPPKQLDIDHYNLWSKRLVGWKQIDSTKACDSQIASGERENISTVAVSAVDRDGLESEKSAPLKIDVINN